MLGKISKYLERGERISFQMKNAIQQLNNIKQDSVMYFYSNLPAPQTFFWRNSVQSFTLSWSTQNDTSETS